MMEDVWGNRIEFADDSKIEHYGIEMHRVLAAIAFFMSDDPEKWLTNCWVSDMSCVGDFTLEDVEIAVIGETLGVPVSGDSYLWEIAKAIHEKGK